MKKLLAILFCMAVLSSIVVFNACENDNNGDALRVKTMTQTEDWDGEMYSWTDHFYYNGSNQLIRIENEDDEYEYTVVQYDSNGKLSKVVYVEDNDNDTAYYSWSGSSLTETYSSEDWKTVYIFNSNSELQKTEDYYKDGTEWVLESYSSYTWQNNNLTNVDHYGYYYYNYAPSLKNAHRSLVGKQKSRLQNRVQATSHLKTATVVDMTLYSKEVYTYDNKPNAFANYEFARIMGVYGSQNNVLTSTETDYYYSEGGDVEVMTYTYTYNSDGYPTHYVAVSDVDDYTETGDVVYEKY